jgi:fumarylacetoacetate (FAA) hydrolase
MKLVSYLKEEHDQLAIYVDGYLYDMELLHPDLPNNMSMFLQYWEDAWPMAQGGELLIKEGNISKHKAIAFDAAAILAPVPFPTSCRDGYAFRQHVAAARRNRNLPMIAAFDEYPVFYFTNHHSVIGPGPVPCMPDHFQQLDFELEAAVVIAKAGRNIPAAEAHHHVAGLMIMNDISARRLQSEEMLLNLGPAKGKDFATVIGPWLVTLDELEPFAMAAKANHAGNHWNLRMKCWVNSVLVSEGNLGDMDWSFAEIIQRASYGANLLPGDVIGSGTVGTGCFLELNGTKKLMDPAYQEQWLQAGDVVEMEIEGLGKLVNTIVKEDSSFSILQLSRK